MDENEGNQKSKRSLIRLIENAVDKIAEEEATDVACQFLRDLLSFIEGTTGYDPSENGEARMQLMELKGQYEALKR